MLQQLLEGVGGQATTRAGRALTIKRRLSRDHGLPRHTGYLGEARLLNLSPLLVVHLLRPPRHPP
ncbi:MAG: hypothetical protein QF714_10065 [Dehalococcoidia bacterium]|nr:hypothetical protein [Dehalococcoidia bacterium]